MKKGDEIEILVEDINKDGKGVGRTEEGYVIFAEKGIPGDKLKVKIRKKKSGYAEAIMLEVIEKSKNRIEPKCNYFGVCGGCKLQNMEYEKQLEFKGSVVKNALQRIGGFKELDIPDVMKAEEIFFYRNKMEFSFSDDKWFDEVTDRENDKSRFALGLHVPKFHSKIVDIKECFLQSEVSNKILNFTRDFFKTKGISIYSTSTHEGYLRFLVIRESRNTSDLMVNLITYDYNEKLIAEYSAGLKKEVPEVTTLVNGFTSKRAQVAFTHGENVIFGNGHINEKLIRKDGTEFKFKISPNSFFQTNTLQSQNLYDIAVEYGEFTKSDNVLDLYCGAGSIAIYISSYVNKVLGVEYIEDAVSNAKENAEANRISNADFLVSDIKDFLESEEIGIYNKIILDPPRSGLHPKISEILSETKLDGIVYLSCNPATQARDLEIICSKGNYEIGGIQPVDMFPHTYHTENVVKLKRAK